MSRVRLPLQLLQVLMGAAMCALGTGIAVLPVVGLMEPGVHVEPDGSIRDFIGFHAIAPGEQYISLAIGLSLLLPGAVLILRALRSFLVDRRILPTPR